MDKSNSDTFRGTVLELERARECVLESVNRIGCEQTGIINTFGRTLAEPIMADGNWLIFDVVLEDGYAARSTDTIGATEKNPRRLGVLAESALHGKKLQPGTVVVVRNGDAVPDGADTVIPFERAYRPHGGPEVLVLAECKSGSNIRSAGTISAKDEVIVPEGTVIGPREMSLLARLGRPGIAVRQKPRVAIVTTGADIVEIVEEMGPGQARNVARYEIVGMVLESGCEVGRLIHVRDGRIGIEKAISDSLGSDIVIIALGSGDKHDNAVAAVANLGDVRFARVHMAPGSATAFGMVEGRPVFIMPGATALESFEAVVRPALMKALGRAEIDRNRVIATLREPMRFSPGYTHQIRAITSFENGHYVTQPLAPTRPSARPNSLVIVPPNIDSLTKGDQVEVMMC
ncbi:MAG: molybdopterin molybdotransferase MoeA [Armatimonadota bacterium]